MCSAIMSPTAVDLHFHSHPTQTCTFSWTYIQKNYILTHTQSPHPFTHTDMDMFSHLFLKPHANTNKSCMTSSQTWTLWHTHIVCMLINTHTRAFTHSYTPQKHLCTYMGMITHSHLAKIIFTQSLTNKHTNTHSLTVAHRHTDIITST